MFGIKTMIKVELFKVKWRKLNSHNYTNPVTIFDYNRVKVGNKTYGDLNVNLGTNPKRRISIGSFCSIGPGVSFVINPHNYRFFSSWAWQIYEYNEKEYSWEKKTDIIVEDDVWIGQGAIVLGGSHLGQGCVIGAGSVVSSVVPPYAIYVGNQVIKYRFSPEICKKLNQIDYYRIDDQTIESIKGWHKIEINENNVDELINLLPLKSGGNN